MGLGVKGLSTPEAWYQHDSRFPTAQHACSQQIVHCGSSPTLIAHTRVLFMFMY